MKTMRWDKWVQSSTKNRREEDWRQRRGPQEEREHFPRIRAAHIPRHPRTNPYSSMCGHISWGNCWGIYCRLTKPCSKGFLASVGTKIEVELSAGRTVRTTHVGIRTIGRTVLSGTAFEVVFLLFYFVKFCRWGFKIKRSFQRIRKNSDFYSS